MSDDTQAAGGTTQDTTTTEETTTTTEQGTTLLGGDATTQQETKTEDAGATTQTETKKDETATEDKGYEFKLPDGVTIDPNALATFTPIAKELGLDTPKAQKIVDAYTQIEKAKADQMKADWEATQTGWLKDINEHPEFGGKNLDANARAAQLAIAKFGTPELKAYLEQTRLGNHPELVRFAMRVGQAMAEDSIHRGGAVTPDAPAEQKLYPSMYPKQDNS